MIHRICLVHYHEIGLKGHNRANFEHRLMDNLKAVLSCYRDCTITRVSGYIVVNVAHDAPLEKVAAAIAASPGVVRVSLGWRTERDMDEMISCAREALFDNDGFETFKVAAHRSNTDFPIGSMEMNQVIGAALCDAAPDKTVKMKDPDVTVYVTVSQASAYIWSRDILGVGGLPVSSAGKVVTLLSAGIDSPVATWKIIRRGAIAIPVHFSGRPQTSDASEYLVKEILDALSPCAGVGRLYVVPFGDYQREISLLCPPKLRIVMYRRLMFCVAERIATGEGAKALVTGESLGQVASQTLDNIRATDEVVHMPVFRPLIGSDKTEIIACAQKLGTYDISIRNAEDCCTLFMPRSPETHAHLAEVHDAWDKLPIEDWVDRICADADVYDYPCPSYHPRKRH